MAFLRSQKFFRFLSVGKNIINFRDVDIAHQVQPINACICSSQNFATASAIKSSQTLDSHLKRLDQDVRRSGRISRRDLEEILEEIRSNKTPTSSQSLLVIRCCGQLVPEEKPEIRTQIVQEIWKTLSSLNVPMDISHYNALLRVYLENEYEFSPTEFLTELQSKGVEPNRVTYQRLISRYCQQGDIDGATRILEFMREKQLPVNENVFNALIMGHSNADDIESAAGILGVMTQAGLEPSADTYTTLLCGFAKKGDLESINKYTELCDQKEIHLLDKDYLEVAYVLAINGHEEKIDSALKNLKKSFGYNQDAVNVILRLVNKGKIDAAMGILKTMPRSTRSDGEMTDTGSFLIKQMVKADSSAEQVLTICKELESTNMHAKPVLIALEESLREGKFQVAKDLLRELQKRGIEIRQHYFWPLIASAKNQDEALEVVEFMAKEFGQELSGQTIRDYIIPKLTNQEYDSMLKTLRNMNVSAATTCTCVAFTAIKKDDLASAAQIMRTFDAYFSPGLFRKPLLFALTATRDFDNYIKILRSIYENMPRLKSLNQMHEADLNESGESMVEESSAEARVEQLQGDVLGSFIMDAAINIRHENLEAVTSILRGLVAEGLSISALKAESIQNRIGEKMTDEISSLLGKLTSGELEPIPFEKRQLKMASRPLTTEGLERLITRLDEKGENTKGMKKQLLIQSIRSKNIEKTEQLVEKLKAEGYTLTNGVYALLLELYATSGKPDEAMKIYKQIKSEEKDFALDDVKAIRLVQGFVTANRVDEAIKFLNESKRETVPESNLFVYNNVCWRILNSLAEAGNIEDLNNVFNAMIENNFATPNNVLLGPLIKVHLLKNEIKEAVDKFEEICAKHRATPCKNELSCKLIQTEDAANLQRITDLSTEVHGEVNSLYDLVFSFIECGRIRQARKILETPGLKVRAYNRISVVCERYVEEGKPVYLEGLVEATKDLNHIDRAEIYYNLMQTYIKEKSVDKCLELWTKMQEEDISPSDQLMTSLATFLKSENVEVPFVVPSAGAPKESKQKTKEAPAATPEARKEARPANDALAQFKNDIKVRHDAGIDSFVTNAENLKLFPSMTVYEKSRVIEALVRADRLKDATEFVRAMLNNDTHPRLNIFRFYLNKLATNGDTDTLEQIGNFLSSDIKKELSFDNRYCHGFVSKGKVGDYLTRLEGIIDEAKTPEEIKNAGEIFPRGGAIGLLEGASTDILKRYNEIARKYAAQNILGPINVLWIHHFLKGEYTEADSIWKEYLSTAPRLMFHRIVQVAREQNNTQLIEKLIGLLQNGATISEGAVGNCYSALIDIQAAKNDAVALQDSLKKAVDAVCLENINTTALNRAKEVVEKAGKTFAYKIPEKKSKKQDSSSSSSSSSSDDDVRKKA